MSTTFAPSSTAAPQPLWKTFLFFLLPMMGSNIMQSLSGTVNNIYLGQMLGVHAVSAVTGFFPILFLLISFCIGLGSGASVLIAQAYGANEPLRVKAVAGTTLTVTMILGFVIAIFGGSFTRTMLNLIGTPPDILADATEYARIFLLSVPLLFIFVLFTTITRGVGDTRTPFFALILSTAISMTLTPALIQGWFGLPRMGVASGAYASIVSFFVTVIWIAWYMLWKKHPLAPDRDFLRQLRIDRHILKIVLAIGLPTGLQIIFVSISEIAVLSFVNAFGSNATAAYGAVNQIVSYVQLPAMSIGITASVFGAQAIGRGNTAMLTNIMRTGIILQFVITGGLILLAYIFSRAMLGLFITVPQVQDIAQGLLHITLWSYVIFGMAAVVSGVMRSSGAVMIPVALSLTAVLGVQVPLSYWLSHRIGLEGVWIAYPIAFAVMLVFQSSYYWFVWRKKTHARLI